MSPDPKINAIYDMENILLEIRQDQIDARTTEYWRQIAIMADRIVEERRLHNIEDVLEARRRENAESEARLAQISTDLHEVEHAYQERVAIINAGLQEDLRICQENTRLRNENLRRRMAELERQIA